MLISQSVRSRTVLALGVGLCLWAAFTKAQQGAETSVASLTQVLGRPTDNSITTNVLAPADIEAYAEYGVKKGVYSRKTPVAKSVARTPFELTMDKLAANTRHYYRLRYRQPGAREYTAGTEYSFQTQRPPGATFTFDVQADSHPERVANMYSPELYARAMMEVRKDHPDFYITLGDDFSVDALQTVLTPNKVDQVYINQRSYLGMDGKICASKCEKSDARARRASDAVRLWSRTMGLRRLEPSTRIHPRQATSVRRVTRWWCTASRPSSPRGRC